MHGSGGAVVQANEGVQNVLGQSIDALRNAEDRLVCLIQKFQPSNEIRSGKLGDVPSPPQVPSITRQTVEVRNLAQRINDRISELDNLL